MTLWKFSRNESGCEPPLDPQCKHARDQRKQSAAAAAARLEAQFTRR